MTNDRVYHYTDTTRLAWILLDWQLDLCGNAVGDYPEPSFLWATTDERGDRTSSAMGREGLVAYRSGLSRAVRITLSAEHFEPWPDITRRFPAWTTEQIARLEAFGRRLGSDPSKWLARAEALSISDALSIETRSYRDSFRWRLLLQPWMVYSIDEETLVIKIGPGVAYASMKITQQTGRRGYLCRALSAADLEEIEGAVRDDSAAFVCEDADTNLVTIAPAGLMRPMLERIDALQASGKDVSPDELRRMIHEADAQ